MLGCIHRGLRFGHEFLFLMAGAMLDTSYMVRLLWEKLQLGKKSTEPDACNSKLRMLYRAVVGKRVSHGFLKGGKFRHDEATVQAIMYCYYEIAVKNNKRTPLLAWTFATRTLRVVHAELESRHLKTNLKAVQVFKYLSKMNICEDISLNFDDIAIGFAVEWAKIEYVDTVTLSRSILHERIKMHSDYSQEATKFAIAVLLALQKSGKETTAQRIAMVSRIVEISEKTIEAKMKTHPTNSLS